MMLHLLRLLLQVLSIVMINIVVLFVQLKLAVYSNWFIAGTMLLGAVIMGKGRTGHHVPAHLLHVPPIISVFIRPELRRVKLDAAGDSGVGSTCWNRLWKKTYWKGSIQGY